MVKNCDRGQHIPARGHSFSPYGPTLSRQITCLFFSCGKLVLQPITNGFVYATLSFESGGAPSTKAFSIKCFVSHRPPLVKVGRSVGKKKERTHKGF